MSEEVDLQKVADKMIEELRSSGAVSGVAVGSAAPLFELLDGTGATVGLADRLAAGPVVVVFYRGGWCPYCNLHLAELNSSLDEIRSLGASLIAISPQRPDDSLSIAEKHDLGFDVLSDPDQQVIRDYHLQFQLPESLHEVYRQMGMGLDQQNADGSWNLPVPATFVIDRSGIVRAGHVDPDYKERMSAPAVLEALRALP